MFVSKDSWHLKIFSIIFLLLPIAFITGPFLPDLFASLIALYFLIISMKKNYSITTKIFFSIFFLYFTFTYF